MKTCLREIYTFIGLRLLLARVLVELLWIILIGKDLQIMNKKKILVFVFFFCGQEFLQGKKEFLRGFYEKRICIDKSRPCVGRLLSANM